MLYKFKSQAAADVIMLEANGRQVLDIIGKSADPKGVIQPEHMAAAIQALERAVALDDANQEANPKVESVRLHQRVVPMIDMLKRSSAEGKEVVWGC